MKTIRIELMGDSSEVVNYDRLGIRLGIREGNLFSHPGLRAPCHWHDDLEFIYIWQGVMAYSVSGQEMVLHPGDSLVVNARQLHFGHDCGGQDCRYLCVLFHPSLFTGSETLLRQEVAPVLEHPACWHLTPQDSLGRTAAEILRRVAALKENAPVGYELEVVGLLQILWSRLARQAGALPPAEGDTDLKSQRDMVSCIYQNYGSKLTLAEIAASGHVSRSKCCQMFRRYLGQSPVDFLNEYRLRVSGHLLRNTDLRITEIALSCGFNHLSYFSKLFTERFGCTPKEYRKREMPEETSSSGISGEKGNSGGRYGRTGDLYH